MGRIINAYILPHPPVIVPEVGKGQENGALKTLEAAKKAALDIQNDRPTTVVVTTPHGPYFKNFVYIPTAPKLQGDLSRFGAREVHLEFENNIDLINRIVKYSKEEGLWCGDLEQELKKQYGVSDALDHGVMVPLYFVDKQYPDFKLVTLSIAGFPLEDLYRFGTCILKAVQESDENVVFIASGDLSHCLSDESPYGFNERGGEFDDLFVNSIRSGDIYKLLEVDEEFSEKAGECGLRSFVMMFGALDGFEISPELYSYEGPFGIGYAVARVGVGQEDGQRSILKRMKEEQGKRMEEIRSKEDPYVRLARKTLETYVKEEKMLEIPDTLPEEMLNEQAGTFVSIKKKGELRGCIGTIGPTRDNIAQEIIYNAISSGTQDPRFSPVEPDELEDLVYSVDVLKEPEPIRSMDELDVQRYGVIVRAGRRSGLLLPNLEGIDSVEDQVAIALQKAGIKGHEKYTLERFEVIRHQ